MGFEGHLTQIRLWNETILDPVKIKIRNQDLINSSSTVLKAWKTWTYSRVL